MNQRFSRLHLDNLIYYSLRNIIHTSTLWRQAHRSRGESARCMIDKVSIAILKFKMDADIHAQLRVEDGLTNLPIVIYSISFPHGIAKISSIPQAVV